jgi:biopolymer transport protein TolR
MAMSLGGGNTRKAEINVTPMIDVLLVLIIIFMVIQPSSSIGLDTQLPPQSDEASAPPAPRNELVITVQADRTVRLNQEPMFAVEDLGKKLRTVFANQVIFVRADKNLEYRQIAEVIDIAKGAGFTRVALMTQ